jgi:ABC-2 type transport system permease protein
MLSEDNAMTSKAITEKPDDRPTPAWPTDDRGPSVMRTDEPTVARAVAYAGLVFVAVGGMTLILRNAAGWQTIVPSGMAIMLLVVGVMGLLFHAASDRDEQVRRLHWILGLLWLTAGVVLPFIPVVGKIGVYFLHGSVCLSVGLLFLLAFLRHETDAFYRDTTLKIIGGLGAAMALLAFVGGNIRGDLLIPYGAILGLIGLGFLWAFVTVHGVEEDTGYKAAVAVGVAGLLAFVVAVGRSVFTTGYLMPTGLTLMGLGVLYLGFTVFTCSDSLFVVLTRREMTAFFYSPIAYIVLFGVTVMAWLWYQVFLFEALPSPMQPPMVEPIVRVYLWGILPVIALICMIPLLTMRLMSEEKRAGTYEILITAPVSETTVVLSKFTAALAIFMIAWLPWVLFLLDLRIQGGKDFDYRPLLTFLFAMLFIGANFLAMGLFFSSLTSSQIASAILTLGAMLLFTVLALMPWWFARQMSGHTLMAVLQHGSYLQHWIDAIGGVIVPKALLYHVSATVFWLFLTVKVLEARRWS